MCLEFPYASQVFRIHRKVIHVTPGKVTQETAYGIISLRRKEASPERLLASVRGHWHIENKLHYVRDFTYDEDRSQVHTANGPAACATSQSA